MKKVWRRRAHTEIFIYDEETHSQGGTLSGNVGALPCPLARLCPASSDDELLSSSTSIAVWNVSFFTGAAMHRVAGSQVSLAPTDRSSPSEQSLAC